MVASQNHCCSVPVPFSSIQNSTITFLVVANVIPVYVTPLFHSGKIAVDMRDAVASVAAVYIIKDGDIVFRVRFTAVQKFPDGISVEKRNGKEKFQ